MTARDVREDVFDQGNFLLGWPPVSVPLREVPRDGLPGRDGFRGSSRVPWPGAYRRPHVRRGGVYEKSGASHKSSRLRRALQYSQAAQLLPLGRSLQGKYSIAGQPRHARHVSMLAANVDAKSLLATRHQPIKKHVVVANTGAARSERQDTGWQSSPTLSSRTSTPGQSLRRGHAGATSGTIRLIIISDEMTQKAHGPQRAARTTLNSTAFGKTARIPQFLKRWLQDGIPRNESLDIVGNVPPKHWRVRSRDS